MDPLIILSLRKGAKTAPEGYALIRCDRRNPILGNQHEMQDQSQAERTRVIAAFRDDLNKDRLANGPMWQEINKLADRVEQGEKLGLQCWCKPKDCHVDVIVSAIKYVLRQRRFPLPGQQGLDL